ncbi:MAG: RnfABCDGE type electron transport complex subunit D [Candidatus Margulisiibacteriota bacterium]
MPDLIISPGPHIKDKKDNAQIMREVLIALIPASAAAMFFFGRSALLLIFCGIVSAVFCEYLIIKVKKVPVTPADLLSATLTGLLLALMVSPVTAWWAVGIGSAVAIIIAKHAFGGLGHNIFNPALVGRAFMLASWPVMMTAWVRPFDAVTSATPLAENPLPVTYLQLLIGNHAGSIGETCILALLLGAAYLFWRRVIEWRIPVAYLCAVVVFSILLRLDSIFQLLAGGLVLGAFFMATDPVTSPVTKSGRWIFGIGAGIITVVIRISGGYPEGVCYAILIMNAATPLLDRYARGRIFGHGR